jgi:hypothetical protein
MTVVSLNKSKCGCDFTVFGLLLQFEWHNKNKITSIDEKDGGAFQILSPKQKFWNTFGKKKNRNFEI